jgi:hypothetical protein
MRGRITKRNLESYRLTVRALSRQEDGGYLVEYRDIPGCMSTARPSRKRLPTAARLFATASRYSGRQVANFYARFTAQAEREGVSINSLVTAIIA